MAGLTKGSPRVTVAKLKFGRHTVPMTAEEAAELEKSFAAWIAKYGLSYGFVRGLLHVQS